MECNRGNSDWIYCRNHKCKGWSIQEYGSVSCGFANVCGVILKEG